MNTSQISERDRVKLKIKALTEKTVDNGCTEQEAVAAMQGVGRLLAQYNLSMDELDVRQSTYKTIFIDINRQRRHPIDGCVIALAKLISAKTWFHKNRGSNGNYAFFGDAVDLELIEYLFKVIHSAMETESKRFKNSVEYKECPVSRKTAYVSFQKAMAWRVSQRLSEIKRENDIAMKQKVTGTALVVLKDQLIKEEFSAWSDKMGYKLTTVYRVQTPIYGKAYEKGLAAGDRVNLSRPLGGNKKSSGYLT
jgi:hypothetical protein